MSIITWQEVAEHTLTYIGRAGYPLNQIKYYLEKDTIRRSNLIDNDIVEKSKLMNYEQVCELIDAYLATKPIWLHIHATTSQDDEVLISIASGDPAGASQTSFDISYRLDMKIKII